MGLVGSRKDLEGLDADGRVQKGCECTGGSKRVLEGSLRVWKGPVGSERVQRVCEGP